MTAGTLVTIEVIVLFFSSPFFYLYHQRKYTAWLAVTQYVLNALFTFSLLICPSEVIVLRYVFFETVFHLCLLVSSTLVLIGTGRMFTDCVIGIFGKK
ncbi:hypothetical protein [Virgibacillus halodenitrificans]|uniref:hypothetical protein n=1 Tax=Virgibacillus halodenitrificans TaxID=1482 RepID=UPI000EF49B25|nr:hypothetical protein [Virgibacillus halodenitrificans]